MSCLSSPGWFAVLTAATWLWLLISTRGAEEPLRFNRDIRPILSDKCFHCHGPDKNKRDSGLRLDIREEALAERDGVRALVPGHPEQSEAFLRLASHDREEMMPPPKAKLAALTSAEVEMMRRWIAEGAVYEPHWAFVPPQPSRAPSFDALVEHGLAQRGLAFQPEAERTTLLRRVSFDLTGLPPTPSEVLAFLHDERPDAYERVVDRLLASPRYGERMTTDWLDLARYADSYGFQVDRERDVWPWRDWVIRAFNQNLPFDQFITWQVAGDLLPHATDEQILATAFNRLHQQESEGGSVEEEYRQEYIADRVQTFSTAFLGLTFECARCHDHKFDPIAQREYYSLGAFFQNIDEAGLYSYFTPSPPTPTLALAEPGQKERRTELQEAVRRAEESLRTLQVREKQWRTHLFLECLPGRMPALLNFLDPPRITPDLSRSAAPLPTEGHRLRSSGEIACFSFDGGSDWETVRNELAPDKAVPLRGENRLVAGRVGAAVQFSGDDGLPTGVGNFTRSQPFSIALWLKTPDVKQRAVIFSRSKAWTDAASRGYELLLQDGKLQWSLIHFWPGNAASIRAQAPLPVGEWVHVLVTSDGSSRAAGLRLYVNGERAEIDVIKDALTREVTGGGSDEIVLGERMRDRGFRGGSIDEFRVFERELTAREALPLGNAAKAVKLAARDWKDLSPEERELLLAGALAQDDRSQQELEALRSAREALAKFEETIPEIMVMRELPEPRKAFVLNRGQYDQHREEVASATPDWLAPWPAGAPRNRLGLAQWLTSPQQPLTARVVVNRFWQGLFGRGLVKTAEDFGSQGARPLYPEVLDWLATQFVQSGWDTKALLKTIVMSRTYRQRSLADAKTMTDDPENEWLARGPRFRLSAEMIRDNALAVSGLLVEKLGGPPVKPFEMSEAFKPTPPGTGDDLHRRSLYTQWRRTSPPPALVAFDAPRRAVCLARRERTNSPLQALVLLNGTQFTEAARVLGSTLLREAKGEVPMMIEQGFLRCLGRLPDAREREIMGQLYEEQLRYYRTKPEEVKALWRSGGVLIGSEQPSAEQAASAILALTLLNHDECVVQR